jgi:hypothetical protein
MKVFKYSFISSPNRSLSTGQKEYNLLMRLLLLADCIYLCSMFVVMGKKQANVGINKRKLNDWSKWYGLCIKCFNQWNVMLFHLNGNYTASFSSADENLLLFNYSIITERESKSEKYPSIIPFLLLTVTFRRKKKTATIKKLRRELTGLKCFSF